MTQGFDEYLDTNYNEKLDDLTKFLIHDAYKAGAASRQAEIDELKRKLQYQEKAYKNVKLQFLNKEDDYNELQNRLAMYERQGYKLVPVEPCEKVLNAMWEALDGNAESMDCIERSYKAMIGAVV